VRQPGEDLVAAQADALDDVDLRVDRDLARATRVKMATTWRTVSQLKRIARR
jgi:hypothetical protein